MKFLLLLIAVCAVFWVVAAWQRRAVRRDPPAPQVGHEDLPACAECGVYLPRSEALAGPDGVFCSEAHRTAFRLRQRG